LRVSVGLNEFFISSYSISPAIENIIDLSEVALSVFLLAPILEITGWQFNNFS